MYEMTLDGKDFFAPANEKYTFIQLDLHEALNDSGYIEAQVPPSNPLYGSIMMEQSKVELLKDGKTRFRGKVQDVQIDFSKVKHLYIVGELSYLNESIQLQQSLGLTKSQLLERFLTAHNKQSNEKFYPGIVSVSNTTIDGLLDYGYTLDAIRGLICGDDGYIKITYRNGRREIDILPIEAYGKQSNQYIRFGSNLLDYVEEHNGETIITAILPRGRRLEESELEGLDSYLTISALNGGSPILVNQAGVNMYGYKCRIVDFDTDDVNALLRYSKAYLTNYQYANLTLRLRAVDLSMVDSSQDDYEVGDYVRAECEPLNMDTWLPVRAKDTKILDLEQNVIDLGMTRSKSLTEATTSSLTSITEAIPQQNSILSAARKDATKQIVEATTGYITTRAGEQTIADNPDINKAVRVWRWNLGGLGYSRNGYNGPYETAITMDGGIVANFVKTGEMSGDRVRGGEFIVGGAGTGKDGKIIGYDANNREIFKLSKDGGWFRGDISAATLSGGAGDTVKNAIDTANEAIEKANEAISKINELASTANTNASTALTNAGTANTNASTALTNAGTAITNAGNAMKKATDAYDLAVSKLSADEVDAYIAKMTNIQVAGMTVRSIFQFQGHSCHFYSPTEKNVMFLGYKTN